MDFIKKKFKPITAILILTFGGLNILCAQQGKNLNTAENKTKTDAAVKDNSIFKGTLADLTWPEVKKSAEENALVLVPVAVIEEHGPHMCLGADIYLTYETCLDLKQKLDSIRIKSVIAPPVYWGIMQLNESGAFPGSFTVSPATMKALLADVFSNLKRWGFKYFYCVNLHGDRLHKKTMDEAVAEAKEKLRIFFYNEREKEDWEKAPDFNQFLPAGLYQPDFHAGAYETSAMMQLYPELVNLEAVKTLKPENRFQPLGYVGDPANYLKINFQFLNSMQTGYFAQCIAEWLKVQKK
jgi:creatinine amidohydrolase